MKNIINRYFRFCPATGRIAGRRQLRGISRLFFPFIGLAALLWILIRVIPKLARLNYPCVRTAMPLASGFIGYLAMIAVSAAAFLKSKKSIRFYPVFFIGAFAVFGISGAHLITSDREKNSSDAGKNDTVKNYPVCTEEDFGVW